ncbi:MAG TPA: ankyrin repeat domain-containing protein [Aquabacterium sp.]|nr:ankyrin repeat domain-containing protein [Aquabacterium sp.]
MKPHQAGPTRRLLAALAVALGVALATTVPAQAGAYEDFFKAVKLDDAAVVEQLMRRGFDPNSVDEAGQGALFLAMREGSFKVAATLLKAPGLKIDQANDAGETALMMAALRGHEEWLPQLVAQGARIEREGWTPLHYAATGPEPATVAWLLERGARVDPRSPNGTTPLMMAARYGSEESVDLLLRRGADPKLRNQLNLSAADFARVAGRESLAQRLAAAAAR